MARTDLDTFDTDRLSAERLQLGHVDLIRQMHRDERVMAHMGSVRSDRDTAEYFERNLAHWAERGYGIWVLHERETKRFVGRGGLRHSVLGGRAEVELAYGLMPQFWGRGLATEFARATAQIGLMDLGFQSVVGITVPDNLASRRVMEKVGFVYERDVTVKGVVNVLYRLEDARHLKGRAHVREW